MLLILTWRKTEWNHNHNHLLNNKRREITTKFWRRGILQMGLQSSTSRKARQGKGKPLQSLSTMVSLLESALREKEGSLQHKGSWEYGDSKLRHFKTSLPWDWAGFYRWGRRELGSLLLWDWPYQQGRFHERWPNHFPSIELPQPNLPTQDRRWFLSLLEVNFRHLYFKNSP